MNIPCPLDLLLKQTQSEVFMAIEDVKTSVTSNNGHIRITLNFSDSLVPVGYDDKDFVLVLLAHSFWTKNPIY